MQLSPNKEIFSEFFAPIPESKENLEYFEKKRLASEVICFWNYSLQKAGLLKCQNNVVSENLWTVNMLKGPKDCLNLHGGNFIIYFHHSETKSAPKYLFYWYLKSWHCLLTYWHPMTSILSQ